MVWSLMLFWNSCLQTSQILGKLLLGDLTSKTPKYKDLCTIVKRTQEYS